MMEMANQREPARRLLFVCVENSCRSQMAEAFARMKGVAGVEAYSAGTRPSGCVHPFAIAVMKELGYDLTRHHSKGLTDLAKMEFEVAVLMGCDDVSAHVHARSITLWDVPAPKGLPLGEFRVVRDAIAARVQRLLTGE